MVCPVYILALQSNAGQNFWGSLTESHQGYLGGTVAAATRRTPSPNGTCVQAADKGSREAARESFGILFSLLHRIDEDPDRIVFFADEAGSWQVPVDWRTVLPTHFKCLASSTRGEEFAREVDRVISDFCHYWRPDLLAAAEDVANDEQRAALARLPVRKGRRG